MSTLFVIETATGMARPDRIPHTQRSTVAWVEGGFYYTVHPAPGSVPAGDENYYRRVRFHRLGDDPAKDELVFGEGRPKEDILGVSTSPDSRWVLLIAYKGWAKSDLYLLDREHPERELATVMEGRDAIAEGFVLDDRVWLSTNLDAPNYRIVAAPCEKPGDQEWETVISEGPDVIQGFDRTRDRIAVLRLVRATSRLTTHDLRGADPPHRLWRDQHFADAGVLTGPRGMGRGGWPLRGAEPARGRRVWRALAPRGHARQEAERIRRLSRRRRSAPRSGLDELAEPRRVWRIERRSPGRCGADAAPGPFRRGILRRATARHASVPELPDRTVLDRRIRVRRGSRPGRVAPRVLAVSQRARGSPVSTGALYDCRRGQPGR